MSIITDWNPKQAKLKEALSKPEHFKEAVRFCLELHGLVHSGVIGKQKTPTVLDTLFEGLTKEAFTAIPAGKGVTIAWNIWHITRIEDITANILIANGKQVLNSAWLKKLGVTVRDTGNAMTTDEITNLSNSVNMDILCRYRDEVCRQTQSILKSLTVQDLQRKLKPESVDRILAEGGVTEHQNSRWLLDFWGKKTVAGIVLMPITRHQIMHLSDSMNIKQKIMKQGKNQ